MMEKRAAEVLVFYSFNGSMENGELKRQLRELAAQGVTGFFVHARAGLEIPYMQQEWLDRFQLCVDMAQELGLAVYIYDENGWPSGFCGGEIPALGETFQYKYLAFSRGVPAGDGSCRVIAAYACGEDGCHRIPVEHITESSLVAYYGVDENYVDLLYRDTVKEFIERTHEVYKKRFGQYFGHVIKGVFTDEPQMRCDHITWSFSAPDFYREAYGSDLLDELWKLDTAYFDEAFSDRYMRMLNTLFRQNFSQQLGDWCAENHLVFTGHYGAEDGLKSQILSNGGVMPHYLYEQIPGIDHLGCRLASPVLMKQVSSAAEMQGKPLKLSEVFGCAGWDVRFNDLAWIWGWHAAFGINLPCLHLSAFSIKGRRKRDYPAFYSYQEPWWEDFHHFAGWMSRVNAFISRGKRRPQVLVLSDVDGSRGCALPVHGEGIPINAASNQFRYLLKNLMDNQVDFDIGDETVLAHVGARVENGCVLAGEFEYTYIIVPDMPSISTAMYRLLKEVLAQDGRVLFVNRRPERLDFGSQQELFTCLEGTVVRNRRDLWDKAFKAMGYRRTAQLTGRLDRAFPENVTLRCAFDGEGQNVLLFHAGTSGDYTDMVFAVPYAAQFVLVQPADGSEQPIESFFNGRVTSAWLDIAATETKLIRVRAAAREISASLPVETQAVRLPIAEAQVELLAPNVLTIDKASYSINDAPYSSVKPVIHLLDEIYSGSTDGGTMSLRMRYTFRYEGGDRNSMQLAFEDDSAAAVAINGIPVRLERTGWYIDRCIGCYAIGGLVREGENTVEITYTAEGREVDFDMDGVFESVKNIFFYAVEPESIYILGDFDVCHDGVQVNNMLWYGLEPDRFVLREAGRRVYADITAQNSWFYRGNVRYTFRLARQEEGKRVFLEAPAPDCALAKVFINGQETGVMMTRPYRLEITGRLTGEENWVEVIACGHNRNVLGPHHHRKGVVKFTGVNTFEGVHGYEDFVSPEITEDSTWMEDYAVIPFGIGPMSLLII